ncbi:hypothetical protein HYT84_00670 [Candidatus Micrarchaeota archaeon]|nr:hypothetical protein [Candidatus Micrarchaeota archaeon]
MKLKNLFFGLILFSVFFAAGSGSGGSASASLGTDCTEDTWACTEFSTCNGDNIKTRSCTMTVDCPNKNTKKPDEILPCDYVSETISNLKCQYKTDIKERVKCRLDLTPKEQLKEIEISYLPEECRAMEKEGEKQSCFKDYTSVQKCWLKEGEEVEKCLKEVTGMTGDIKKETGKCMGMGQPQRGICTTNLRTAAYKYIKFKMYYLEQEAEELLEDGKVSKEDVVNFIADVETQKREFNKANTNLGKKNVIKAVQSFWKEFIKKVKSS